jgi:hypothetical protein
MTDESPKEIDGYALTANLETSAHAELAAFVGAVSLLFGEEEARRSAEDWIGQLEWMDWPAEKPATDLRQLTIAAAASLASRMNGQNSTSLGEMFKWLKAR